MITCKSDLIFLICYINLLLFVTLTCCLVHQESAVAEWFSVGDFEPGAPAVMVECLRARHIS